MVRERRSQFYNSLGPPKIEAWSWEKIEARRLLPPVLKKKRRGGLEAIVLRGGEEGAPRKDAGLDSRRAGILPFPSRRGRSDLFQGEVNKDRKKEA